MQKVGDVEIRALSDGFFALDGGAMFGIVPRLAWEKRIHPDRQHRVRLALNLFLVRAGGKTILFDTGIGGHHDEKFADAYALERSVTLEGSLKALGMDPGDIDLVVPSHLHFDHTGGLSVPEPGGNRVPAFPKAEVVVQEGAWEEALDPNPRTHGSYLKSDFLPVERCLKTVRGSEEIAPGVWVERTSGHVEHHQILRVRSGGHQAVCFGDLVPTEAHLKPAWGMGYDLRPKEVAASKKNLVEQAVNEDWLVCLDHDPKNAMVRLKRGERGLRVIPVEPVNV